MKNRFSPGFVAVIIMIVLAALLGCTPGAETPKKLRVAVLPVLDSFPLYVAQQEGFFTARGVEVELLPVGSAPERDQLIAANQADGMMTEALSAVFANQQETRLQIVRYARSATAEYPLFSIVASGNSSIERPEQLAGVPIGISEGTVIEYLTDRLLQHAGLQPDQIQKVAVPDIRTRMTLLGSGELQAGVLPEPLTTLSVQQGGHVVLDDTARPELSYSVLIFRKAVIDENPEGVRAFLRAVEDAVEAINNDRGRWDDLLRSENIIPEPLQGSFQLPPYITAGVPSEAQYDDMQAWALDKGLLRQAVPYSQSVNSSLLPE